jgi:hypothetical protein
MAVFADMGESFTFKVRKNFFFEKKKQKTFANGVRGLGAGGDQLMRAYRLFFF